MLGRDIRGPLPNTFENMRHLERIDLSVNGFEGRIPKSLGNLCSLKDLVLYSNNFYMRFHDLIESFSGCAKDSLEILDLTLNQLGESFPDLKNLPFFLRELYIDDNQLEGPLPDLSMIPYLRVFDVPNNKLNGTLPESIGELYHLESLDISSNSLTGVVSEIHFDKLSKLKELILFSNSLTLNFKSSWVPPFQLNCIRLSSGKLGPQFPS